MLDSDQQVMYLLRTLIENFYRGAVVELLQWCFHPPLSLFLISKDPFCRTPYVIVVESLHHLTADVWHLVPCFQLFRVWSLRVALFQ